MDPITIRPATTADLPLLLRFIRELAAFVHEPDAVVATEALLQESLFGRHPYAEAVIASLDDVPCGMAASAGLVLRERLGVAGWFALVASTVGVVLVVLPAGPGPLGSLTAAPGGPSVRGDLLVVVSLCAGMVWVLVSKHLMHRYVPLAVSASIMLSGAVMLALWVLLWNGLPPVALSARTWFALAGQGLLATTLATVLWNWGLSAVPASHAGVFLNFEPIVGTMLGVLLLHEPLGTCAAVGGLCIIGAATVMTWRAS